jgi:hypothetical protein
MPLKNYAKMDMQYKWRKFLIRNKDNTDLLHVLQSLFLIKEFMHKKFIIKHGERFNNFIILSEVENGIGATGHTYRRFLCKCDCGNEGIFALGNLTRQTSCIKCRKPSLTHGKKGTSIYNIWCSMKGRCNNKNLKLYKWYGARGIKVCKKWEKFENFYSDIGKSYKKGLTLERIDNHKGYSKENCKWATYKEQANNTRRNLLITYKNKTLNFRQWCTKLGLIEKEKTLFARYRRYGWSIEKTFTEPINTSRNRILTFKGESKTLAQWAKIFNLRRDTLWRRLKSGWSIKKAFETPTRLCNRLLTNQQPHANPLTASKG